MSSTFFKFSKKSFFLLRLVQLLQISACIFVHNIEFKNYFFLIKRFSV